MSRLLRIENLTRSRVLAERCELADNPWRRMKGLLGRPGLEPGQGLVIRPCQGVHTLFMAFPIDVLHVDRGGVVRRVIESMPPQRLGPMVWRSSYVIELPAGVARASGTAEGDQVALVEEPEALSA